MPFSRAVFSAPEAAFRILINIMLSITIFGIRTYVNGIIELIFGIDSGPGHGVQVGQILLADGGKVDALEGSDEDSIGSSGSSSGSAIRDLTKET